MSPNRKILSIEITQMIDTMLFKGVQKVPWGTLGYQECFLLNNPF